MRRQPTFDNHGPRCSLFRRYVFRAANNTFLLSVQQFLCVRLQRQRWIKSVCCSVILRPSVLSFSDLSAVPYAQWWNILYRNFGWWKHDFTCRLPQGKWATPMCDILVSCVNYCVFLDLCVSQYILDLCVSSNDVIYIQPLAESRNHYISSHFIFINAEVRVYSGTPHYINPRLVPKSMISEFWEITYGWYKNNVTSPWPKFAKPPDLLRWFSDLR